MMESFVGRNPRRFREIWGRSWVVLGVVIMTWGCARQEVSPPAPPSPPQSSPAAAPIQRTEILVYVPCGMVIPFKELSRLFEQKNPGIDIDTHFDKPATIAHDIVDKRHRPDVFVSPGHVEIGIVEEADLIDPSTKRSFATYSLGLVVTKDHPAGIKTVEDLAKPEVKGVVLADPKDNSVGVYAKEVLQKRGVWDQVEKKVLYTGDATAGLKVILDGKAQASITSQTCPFVTAPEAVPEGPLDFIETIPSEQHSRIECVLACLNTTEHPQESRQFVDFIASEEAQKKLEELGMPILKSEGEE